MKTLPARKRFTLWLRQRLKLHPRERAPESERIRQLEHELEHERARRQRAERRLIAALTPHRN